MWCYMKHQGRWGSKGLIYFSVTGLSMRVRKDVGIPGCSGTLNLPPRLPEAGSVEDGGVGLVSLLALYPAPHRGIEFA